LVRKPAFSLVKLVIVIVIIGIIAAIAVPRISRGAKGASDEALRGSLRVFRGAIELYAAEHGGNLPAQDQQEQTFIDQLTKKTDSAGNVGNTAGVHIYGPYVRSIPGVPVGPNVGAKRVKVRKDVNEGEWGGTAGWIYDHETGNFFANTDDLDETGVGYDTY
jgi:type II secretory pathway pseudopilin PulG